ncbi:MAG TPA: gliding motility protein, partial [Flavobacteriales bacterium]|nr:gliding motility protein [Flavobacteriales bacterium]
WNAAAANQTTATATGLSAGILYQVTVTDDNQCTAITNISLTQPVALFTVGAVTLVPYNGAEVSCVGSTDGFVVSSTNNGSGDPANYIYNWGAVEPNNDSLINVGAGNYCVTVTDSLGCIATNCATVNDPPVLTATINGATVVNVNCFGDSTGAAEVTPAGGTLVSVYSFLWDNGQTTAAANGFLAGNQCVTVTDANGCTAVTCVNITEAASAVVIASMSVDSNVSCNGFSDGGATVVAGGGVPSVTNGYNFIWSTSATTASVSGLAVGIHCVTVTDSLGCFDSECITITEPSAVTATITSSINVNCFGDSSGTATVTGSGGTAVSGYTFLWSANTGNQTTATATGLQANVSYCVTVIDNNGCVSPGECVTLTQPVSSLVASASEITPVSCSGGNDGVIQASSVGGSGSVTFQWDANASSQNTQSVSGLAANTYCVTITDSLGCTDSACVILTEPSALTITAASLTNVICRGDSTGEITLGVSGGTPGYSFQWDAAADSVTTPLVVGLPAGTYCVVVKDNSGCQDSLCIPITQPASAVNVIATVISNYNGSQIQCFGDSSGVAVAVASGGTVAVDYQYNWSVTTQTTDTAVGLPDGIFVVTVTDDLGCSDTAVVTLVDPTSVVATITTVVPVSCLGDCNGSATVSGSGGTGIVYTFLWDAAALNQTTGTATGLCAGLYAVTVSDINGCEGVTSVNITEPLTSINATAVVSSNFLGQDVSCNNAFDGTATASAVGGTPGYTFLWSGTSASGQTTDTAVGLGAGTYCV